jgi:hypothetical protein
MCLTMYSRTGDEMVFGLGAAAAVGVSRRVGSSWIMYQIMNRDSVEACHTSSYSPDWIIAYDSDGVCITCETP